MHNTSRCTDRLHQASFSDRVTSFRFSTPLQVYRRRQYQRTSVNCGAAMAFLSNPGLLGAGIVVVTALTAAILRAKKSSKLPELFMQQTAFNRAVLSRCPTINTIYQFFPFISLNGYVSSSLEHQTLTLDFSSLLDPANTNEGWLLQACRDYLVFKVEEEPCARSVLTQDLETARWRQCCPRLREF